MAATLTTFSSILKEIYSDRFKDFFKSSYRTQKKKKRYNLSFNDPLLPFYEDELIILDYEK